jgi:hypothetical protein
MNKRAWNTYRTTCYTHDVAQDQASAGGVHLHQVRLGRAGWQHRIEQSNGWHSAYGQVTAISDAEGEAHFATAAEEE